MSRPPEYYFREGCFIEEWQNSPQYPDLSVARVRVEPGATTKLHSLINTVERYIILCGEAVVEVGGEKTCVSEGDVTEILAGIPQRISNTANYDLVFLAICTPRFKEKNYQALE